MNIIKKEACFTINNCDFVGIQNFRNKFLNSEKCKILSDSIQEMNVIVKINGMEIKNSDDIPLIVFGNANLQIRYDNLNKQISIDTNDYDKNSDLVIKFLGVLASFKFQDITSIKLKFLSECDNGTNKLQIFTQNINNFPNWIHNEDFEVKIPINDPDVKYKEVYYISKIKGGQKEQYFENYIYRVVGDYKYKFDENKIDIEDRLQIINDIVSDVPNVHCKFVDVCKKTMEL